MPTPLTMRPEIGMIVSCLFPLEEDISQPDSPPPRPTLIVGVHRPQDPKMPYVVMVAYGSAAKSTGTTHEEELRDYQVEIHPETGTGLREITRFDFVKSLQLDWTSDWFVPLLGKPSVKLGSLPVGNKEAANLAKEAAKNYLAANPGRAWGRSKLASSGTKNTEIVIRKKRPRWEGDNPATGGLSSDTSQQSSD